MDFFPSMEKYCATNKKSKIHFENTKILKVSLNKFVRNDTKDVYKNLELSIHPSYTRNQKVLAIQSHFQFNWSVFSRDSCILYKLNALFKLFSKIGPNSSPNNNKSI